MCSGLLNVTFGMPVISRKLISNFPEVLTSADMTNPICPIGFACVSGTIHSIDFTSLFESSYSSASICFNLSSSPQYYINKVTLILFLLFEIISVLIFSPL